MAKWKTKKSSRRAPKRPSRKLLNEISIAMELFEDGEINAAQSILSDLAKRNPRSKPVLYALLEIAIEVSDWYSYAYYGEQLLPIESGEGQAETLNNMVYAYSELLYPALAWYFARELLTKHPDYEHADRAGEFVRRTEPFLIEEVGKMTDVTDFTKEEKLDLLLQQDRIRFYTQSGHPEESIVAARRVLEKVPDFVSVLNNLSLSQFMVGSIDQAKETAQNVLTKDVDNFHALANLVRFNVLTAQFGLAHEFAGRLRKITGDNPDLETKKAEAFAFLGDDESVLAAYERSIKKHDEQSILLLHLAAVASYRSGDEKKAWRLWKKAVKLNPTFDMAQESLAEKSLPVGERDVPWYWPLQYWFPQDIPETLKKYLDPEHRKLSDIAVQKGVKSLLEERPYFVKLFPHILEFGDRVAREFVLNFIRLVETPECLQILYDFVHCPFGADDLRLDAVQFITEKYPEMLPEDKRVTMWINGQQKELFMLGFEITDETEVVKGVSEKTLDKHDEAYQLLMDREPEAAEILLKVIIEEAPNFYSAYNQLAIAYEMQDKHEEARALVEETRIKFPDYLFARVAQARMLVRDKQIEKAKDVLEPLFRLQKLHISEFRALAAAQIEVSLAEKQMDAAQLWLEMWERVDEGNPELLRMQVQVKGPGLLKELKTLLKK